MHLFGGSHLRRTCTTSRTDVNNSLLEVCLRWSVASANNWRFIEFVNVDCEECLIVPVRHEDDLGLDGRRGKSVYAINNVIYVVRGQVLRRNSGEIPTLFPFARSDNDYATVPQVGHSEGGLNDFVLKSWPGRRFLELNALRFDARIERTVDALVQRPVSRHVGGGNCHARMLTHDVIEVASAQRTTRSAASGPLVAKPERHGGCRDYDDDIGRSDLQPP